MKPLIGIIADDLTGANDSGVQLTANGINTSVFFDVPDTQKYISGEGIVIDTNSRTLDKEKAKQITKLAGEYLYKIGCKFIFKKIDSTLRGHIGPELAGLNDVLKPEFVIIAPAFPEYGRTTINGIHYVYGERLTDTEILSDPHLYVAESNVVNIVSEEISEPIELLTKEHLDLNLMTRKINEFKRNGIKWIVSDAETEEDLQKLVAVMLDLSNDVLWVGSAGLFKVLSEKMKASKKLEETSTLNTSQIIVVCGSLSEVSKSQINYATKYSNVSPVAIDINEIFSEDWKMYSLDYRKKCLIELDKGQDLILYLRTNESTKEQLMNRSNDMKKSTNEIGEMISDALTNLARSVIEMHNGNPGLILTGGNTARNICEALDGERFTLEKQAESGIAIGTLHCPSKKYRVATKAGALGKESSVHDTIQVLKGMKP